MKLVNVRGTSRGDAEMKLKASQPPYEEFTATLTTEHPPSIPGRLAIKRSDTGALIALRDIMGTALTVKYQLLEVTPAEKDSLEKEGLVIASSAEDLQNWYQQWDGPKPSV